VPEGVWTAKMLAPPIAEPSDESLNVPLMLLVVTWALKNGAASRLIVSKSKILLYMINIFFGAKKVFI
jgi:hypothetical protein